MPSYRISWEACHLRLTANDGGCHPWKWSLCLFLTASGHEESRFQFSHSTWHPADNVFVALTPDQTANATHSLPSSAHWLYRGSSLRSADFKQHLLSSTLEEKKFDWHVSSSNTCEPRCPPSVPPFEERILFDIQLRAGASTYVWEPLNEQNGSSRILSRWDAPGAGEANSPFHYAAPHTVR